MRFYKFIARSLLAGGCLILANPATAANQDWQITDTIRGADKTGAAGYERLLPQGDLLNRAETRPNIQLAQSDDAAFRVNQLEEQIRLLNGKVEDMTFQLLQMQEQIRKMQEDNEFRFQELEQRGDAKIDGANETAQAGGESLGKPLPSDQADTGNGSDGTNNTNNSESIESILDGNDLAGGEKLGAPPAALGSLTFDGDGNVVDSNVGAPIDLTKNLASVQFPEAPDQLFNLGYEYVQAGEYSRAEEVFNAFVANHPGDAKMPEAKFWLGESHFSQGHYEEAARVFLENHKENPKAALGAQNLLKLGVSLAGLNQRELACATYAEVPKKYPDLSNAVRKRVDVEQRAAKCKNG
ncbi:MAG: tol-pal system protein YbgF [Salaquimonas sp.]